MHFNSSLSYHVINYYYLQLNLRNKGRPKGPSAWSLIGLPLNPSPLHPQAAPKAGSMIRSLPSASHYLYTESLVLAISILTDFDIPMPKNLNLVQIFLFYLLYISALIEFLFLLVRQEIFLTASPFTKSPDLERINLYSERILTSK